MKTETIQVKYNPETKMFIEKNPEGDEPYAWSKWVSRFKYKQDKWLKWNEAESNLRSFPLPDEAEELAKDESSLLPASTPIMERINFQMGIFRGFNARKEKYKFKAEDVIGFVKFLDELKINADKQFKNVPRFADTKQLLTLYTQSLHQFKPGIIYNAEITDGIITKIEQA